jgi:nitroreductase
VIDELVELARRAPSAGNAQGFDVVVLEGADTARFWDVTLPADRRPGFRWPDLLQAPAIVLPFADRDAYLARYGEPDKAATGLAGVDRWPVPYWQLDAAMAVMVMLLAAQDAGLGALWFGVFRDGERLLEVLGVPPGHELIGALAIGHPLSSEPGRSAARPRRPLEDVLHRGHW